MPLMYNAMVNARLVGRSLFSVLLFAALCAPSLSFGWSWGHHHSPRPQLVVDGREVLFTVLPTVDKDHVFRAPVDFVHMLGGDYVVGKDADALTVTGCDGRSIQAPYIRDNDRCIVDVKQVAESLGADAEWDGKRGTLTLRAKVMLIREQGGKLNVVTSYPVAYSTGALSNPSRIYIDMTGAVLPNTESTVPIMADGVTMIRSKQVDYNTVRIALDLTHIARVADAPTGKFNKIQVALGAVPSTHPAPVPPVAVVSNPPRTDAPIATSTPDEVVRPLPVVQSATLFTITGVTSQTSTDGKLQVVITTTGQAIEAPRTSLIEKTADRPDRFAVDLPSAALALPPNLASETLNLDDPVVRDVRWGTAHVNDRTYTRFVLDLSAPAQFNVTAVPTPTGDGTVYTIAPGTGDVSPLPQQLTPAIEPPGTGDGSEAPVVTTPGSLKNLTIVVDPGHGGKDGGAPGVGGIWEKDLTLAIGTDLRDDLVAEGVHVIMTREDDTFIPLSTRSQMGVDNNADLFISIHCDSGSGHNAQEGSTVYYHGNDLVCKNLALCIAAKIKEANYGITSDGVKTDYIRFPGVGFSVLRRSPEPAVLCECGYVNNDDDAKLLTSADTQKSIAAAIVAGCKDYIGSKVASR